MYLAFEPEIQFWFSLLIQIHWQSVMNKVSPLHQWIWYLVYAVLPVQRGSSQVSQILQAIWIPSLKMRLRRMWNCLPLLQLPLLSMTFLFQGAERGLIWWEVTRTHCTNFLYFYTVQQTATHFYTLFFFSIKYHYSENNGMCDSLQTILPQIQYVCGCSMSNRWQKCGVYQIGVHVYSKCILCLFPYVTGLNIHLLQTYIYCYRYYTAKSNLTFPCILSDIQHTGKCFK